MGTAACLLACRYILEETSTRTVVDPFCGWGTALAVANALGLAAVGVDRSARMCRRARALVLRIQRRAGGARDRAAAAGWPAIAAAARWWSASAIASRCCPRATGCCCCSTRASGGWASGPRGWPTWRCPDRSCGWGWTSRATRWCGRCWRSRRSTCCFPGPRRLPVEQLPRDQPADPGGAGRHLVPGAQAADAEPGHRRLAPGGVSTAPPQRLRDPPAAGGVLPVDHRGAGRGAGAAGARGRWLRAPAGSVPGHGRAAALVRDRRCSPGGTGAGARGRRAPASRPGAGRAAGRGLGSAGVRAGRGQRLGPARSRPSAARDGALGGPPPGDRRELPGGDRPAPPAGARAPAATSSWTRRRCARVSPPNGGTRPGRGSFARTTG